LINWHDINLSKDMKIKTIHIQEIRDILDDLEPLLCQMEHNIVNVDAEISNYNDHDVSVLTAKQFTNNGIYDSTIDIQHDEHNWSSNQIYNNRSILLAVDTNNNINDKTNNDITVDNDHNENQHSVDNIDILTDVKNSLFQGFDTDRQNIYNSTIQISEYPSSNRYVYLNHNTNDFSNYNENN